ncbi:voltage-dependent calcium channel gamma-5 subunit-like [Aplysia californica]|uniref:Voltage-dependent calcium channel gamma-5 subunit-like n=1 Tax=Aplysia californica TaxID=6500 RepID=A0ABM0JF76_APLCA|nr:voltage-dependent calcium channel gamma-5 subunit-like [Aplysia californica]
MPIEAEEFTVRRTNRRNRDVCSAFIMTCVSVTFGAATACSMVLAVATDHWLFTSEPYFFTAEERSMMNLTDLSSIPKVPIHVRSGLWRVCTVNILNGTFPDQCISIDYRQPGSGRMEGARTCMAIVGAIRYSTPMFVGGLVLVAVAVVLHFVGTLHQDVKTVISAVLYIATGLSLAVGIIIYISAINDEVGYSFRNRRHIDFEYDYGWSFYTTCLAFLSAKCSAVMCISQYLKGKHRMQDMVQIIPGLEEKLEADKSRDETEPPDCRSVRVWGSRKCKDRDKLIGRLNRSGLWSA